MSNIAIAIIDEDNSINNLVINEKLLLELTKRLRNEGITQIHTAEKTYNAKAIVVPAKGMGKMLIIPIDENE